ncbi:MAG TPA: Rieske 2Fe-2S domain-containing protein, partial [Chloroflexota bacterium]
MLSHEENQLLTRTDRGTPAGELFRRHWIPALQADEVVEPDGTPVRVRLLGERLVAFRDSNGKVGLVDEFCAHRGASLALARNEECGLRCLYHGWKYDVEGRCLDQPAEPAGSNFKDKIRQTAYPVREAGGVIWTYMGSASDIPPFPDFQWTRVPESQRVASKILEECNYLQGLEGGVDGIHSAYLHRALTETYTPWGIA